MWISSAASWSSSLRDRLRRGLKGGEKRTLNREGMSWWMMGMVSCRKPCVNGAQLQLIFESL